MDFVDIDDNTRQWVADFNSKSICMPHRLESMDGKCVVRTVLSNIAVTTKVTAIRASYSKTFDSGPSEVETQYNRPLYKGCFAVPK